MQLPLALRGARRHPFRHHVRQVIARQRKASEDGDVKLFALSFTAFFICFSTFLL